MLASSSYFQRIHNKYVDALAADPEDRDGAVALLAELVNAGMSHLSCHEALREAFAAFLELFPRSEGLDAPSSGGPPGDAATDEEIDEYIARELTYLRRDVSKDRLDRILAAAQKKSLPPSVDQPRVEPNRVPTRVLLEEGWVTLNLVQVRVHKQDNWGWVTLNLVQVRVHKQNN